MREYNIKFSSSPDTASHLYRQLPIIKAEMSNLGYNFQGSIVFCDCDESIGNDFFEYFLPRFNSLELKKLISVCYLPAKNKYRLRSYMVEVNEAPDIDSKESGLDNVVHMCEALSKDPNNSITLRDNEYVHPFSPGKESPKSFNYFGKDYSYALSQADIVFADTPVFLFEEYMNQIIDKPFLAFSLQPFFPYGKHDLLWEKVHLGNQHRQYWAKLTAKVNWKDDRIITEKSGNQWMNIGEACFVTNLDYASKNPFLRETKR